MKTKASNLKDLALNFGPLGAAKGPDMHKSICWHTRLNATGEKTTGGSFGGAIDMETVERLVKAHFTVVVAPSGYPNFVDKQGRNVNLYINVHPRDTAVGKAAIKAYQEEQHRLAVLSGAEREKQEKEIQELVDSLGYDEAVRRLKNL